ncbi:MAG: glutamate--tRNA ligase [Chloroflexi bacterium]|nr:glutamate--tRNA ligase [Chloroflexota bacterium]
MDRVRVRYAPSPTGYPHIGNIRTALFNWLFARHMGGSFIVRIEDTDQARKVEGAVESILDSLRWLGLDWDEGPEVGGRYGPYFQSERLDLYQRFARQLLESGQAYRCYCASERLSQMRAEMAERKEAARSYDRRCRSLSPGKAGDLESQGVPSAIRFKAPLEGQTAFQDLIRGEITFDNSELDDLVLLKSDGYPTYHLANVVDDHFMEVSHVMRADEWLSSTPRHVLLYAALGWRPPLYAHLPMILGPDKSKLSKRHGATSVVEYRDRGFLTEAMVNFLALLGWALDDKTEVMGRDELIRHFSIERISKTAAIFNQDKLQWMNGVYIRQLVEKQGHAEFARRALPFLESGLPERVKRPIDGEYVVRITPLAYERVNLLSELPARIDFFFLDELDYDAGLLVVKGMDRETAIAALRGCLQRLGGGPFDHTAIEGVMRSLAEELGLKPGPLFGLVRVAVTGRTATPPLFETMAVLGRDRCLRRLESALARLESSHAA